MKTATTSVEKSKEKIQMNKASVEKAKEKKARKKKVQETNGYGRPDEVSGSKHSPAPVVSKVKVPTKIFHKSNVSALADDWSADEPPKTPLASSTLNCEHLTKSAGRKRGLFDQGSNFLAESPSDESKQKTSSAKKPKLSVTVPSFAE